MGNKFTENWLFKLAAVVCAVLIWVFITVSSNPLRDAWFTVSVELRGVSPNLTMENTNYEVKVRVQGPSAAISNLRAADIEAYLDFTGLLAGEVTVDVKINVPKDTMVIGQNYNSITVELKEKRSEMFPLTVDVLGETASSYKVLDPVLSPAEVRLWGTEDYIRRVDKVYVAASIHDIEESFEKDLSIMVLDKAGSDISAMFTIDPKVAKVVIPVVYQQPERSLAVRVPIVGEPALGYQVSLISVTPQTVRVFGDLQRLQNLDYVETEPMDVSDLRFDESRTLNLVLGNGFTAERRQVTVALKIEPVNYATFTKTLVLSHNVSPGLQAEIEQQQLEVMVYGPETFIATIDEADIVPYVDCADLEPGLHMLPVRVSLPPNILVMNISLDTVAVTLTDTTITSEEGEADQEEEGEENPPETPPVVR